MLHQVKHDFLVLDKTVKTAQKSWGILWDSVLVMTSKGNDKNCAGIGLKCLALEPFCPLTGAHFCIDFYRIAEDAGIVIPPCNSSCSC